MERMTAQAPSASVPEKGELSDDWLEAKSVAEVAELFGVVPATIRREIKRGSLDAIRVGRSVRITKAALLRYVGEGDGE